MLLHTTSVARVFAGEQCIKIFYPDASCGHLLFGICNPEALLARIYNPIVSQMDLGSTLYIFAITEDECLSFCFAIYPASYSKP